MTVRIHCLGNGYKQYLRSTSDCMQRSLQFNTRYSSSFPAAVIAVRVSLRAVAVWLLKPENGSLRSILRLNILRNSSNTFQCVLALLLFYLVLFYTIFIAKSLPFIVTGSDSDVGRSAGRNAVTFEHRPRWRAAGVNDNAGPDLAPPAIIAGKIFASFYVKMFSHYLYKSTETSFNTEINTKEILSQCNVNNKKKRYYCIAMKHLHGVPAHDREVFDQNVAVVNQHWKGQAVLYSGFYYGAIGYLIGVAVDEVNVMEKLSQKHNNHNNLTALKGITHFLTIYLQYILYNLCKFIHWIRHVCLQLSYKNVQV